MEKKFIIVTSTIQVVLNLTAYLEFMLIHGVLHLPSIEWQIQSELNLQSLSYFACRISQ